MVYKPGLVDAKKMEKYERQRELESQCTSAEELKIVGRPKYAIDFKNKIIKIAYDRSAALYYSFDEILSSSVETNGKTTEEISLGSMLGRAAIGSLFGGAGMIIGGLTAKKKQKTEIKSVALKIAFTDNPQFQREIEFFNRGYFSGMDQVSAQEKATQIHECIAKHLASMANKKKGSVASADGLASELSIISDLHKRGMLSDTEFKLAKKRLLAK